MDTIFYNGTIYTQDKAYENCSAVAVKNGIITALGEDEEILRMAEENTLCINLDGKFMVPGFVDSHLHLIRYALEKRGTELVRGDLDELKELILEGASDAAKLGITEVHSDDFKVLPDDEGELILEAYRQLSEEGKLKVRVYQQCNLQKVEGYERFLEKGYGTGDDYGFFRIGPLKLITDGGLGGHTAALLLPYSDEPETTGRYNYTDEEVESIVTMAQNHHMQLAIHCIGDGAAEQALKALRKAHYGNPQVDMRHGIIHCQIMTLEQQEEMRRMNLIAYIQPVFVRYDMNIADGCVGRERAASGYNWRRFADLKVHQASSSDCPDEDMDVLNNIAYAVTRKNPDTGKSWYPENGLTLEEALRTFTYEGAYASFSEQVKGTITVGKYADLTVIDRNLFQIPAEEIHRAKVVLTMTGGKITYRRKEIKW